MLRSYFLILCTLLCVTAHSQQSAFEKKYLVDDLDIASISDKDRLLIDSALTLFRECNSDICRIGAVSLIVQQSYDINVWPSYNRWIHDYASLSLQNTELDSATRQTLNIAYIGALSNIGYLFNATGEPDSALIYYNRCLDILEEVGDKASMSGTYVNMGYIALNQGAIEKALDYYYGSLRLEEELGNKRGIATALNGIGYIQYKQGDNKSALENYHQSLAIRRELKDEYGTATCLNNIGLVFQDKGQWEEALYYFQQCLELQQKIEDKSGIAISLSNIALAYKSTGRLTKARTNYVESLKINQDQGDKLGMAGAYNNLAKISLDLNSLSNAKRYANESLRLGRELQYPQTIRDAAETLSSIAKREGRWQDALSYYELYAQMRDSVFNEETVAASVREQYKYIYEKQALADSISNANARQIQEAENASLLALATKRRAQATFLTIGIVLSVISIFMILNRMKTIKKQKATIEDQNDELELQRKNLSQFAHTVSHDLKTPINGILGLMSLIEYEHNELDEELRAKLNLMKKSAVQSNDLINGILAYSEAGQQTLDVQDVDVNLLLKSILEELPNDKNVRIELDDHFPVIRSNKLQLKQVFTNLINNAIKYNDKPAGKGTVTVTAGKNSGLHQFTVTDNGPGIPVHLHKTAFELFGKTHKGKYAFSSGIGLSIVKKLVEQNGGTIKLDSDKGKGAKFTFTWRDK